MMSKPLIIVMLILVATIFVAGCTDSRASYCDEQTFTKTITISRTDYGSFSSFYYLYSTDGRIYAMGSRILYDRATNLVGSAVTVTYICGDGHYQITAIQSQSCPQKTCGCVAECPCSC